jgi:hypothetical protein
MSLLDALHSWLLIAFILKLLDSFAFKGGLFNYLYLSFYLKKHFNFFFIFIIFEILKKRGKILFCFKLIKLNYKVGQSPYTKYTKYTVD